MKRCADTCVFTSALGARLRELRLKAGLTQAQLMVRAGRAGKGAALIASRLEQGKTPYPSIGLVADYLRGCGAGFSDLLEQLKPLTARPPEPAAKPAIEPEQQARTEQPEARQRRAEAFKDAIVENEPLDEVLGQLVDSHGWTVKPGQRRWLVKTARGICRAHWRWPRRKHRRLEDRAARGMRAARRRGLDPAMVQDLGDEIGPVLTDLELNHHEVYAGSATLVGLGETTKREKAWDERSAQLAHCAKMKAFVESQAQRAAHEALEPLVAEGFMFERLSSAARILATIAALPEPDLETKRRMIADYAASWKRRTEQAIKAGEAALAAWEKYKVMIPPDPDSKP